MKEGNNIWSHVKNIFRPYTPSIKALSTSSGLIKNSQEIADHLANYCEKYFAEPVHDNNNTFHRECLRACEEIGSTDNVPLDQIGLDEIIQQWTKFAGKKSLDILRTSAFML